MSVRKSYRSLPAACLLLLSFLICQSSRAQLKYYLDSAMRVTYLAKYPFRNGLALLHYHCDGKNTVKMTKAELALCDKYVFVDTGFNVRIGPVFEMPCVFYPRFSEGFCAVSIKGNMVYIDTAGNTLINLGLKNCGTEWVNAGPFENGIATIQTGSSKSNKPTQTWYINKKGEKVEKPAPVIVVSADGGGNGRNGQGNGAGGDLNAKPAGPIRPRLKNKLVLDEKAKRAFLSRKPFINGLAFVEYRCDARVLQLIDTRDTFYCNKYVFVDSALNIKFPYAYEKPCTFFPEFSEGLCAVAQQGKLHYINDSGIVVITLNAANCGKDLIVPGPFKDSVATIYRGNPETGNLDPLFRIDKTGKRMPELGFDEVTPARYGLSRFQGLTPADCVNRYIGKGRTNGLYFLLDANGKVFRKLSLSAP